MVTHDSTIAVHADVIYHMEDGMIQTEEFV